MQSRFGGLAKLDPLPILPMPIIEPRWPILDVNAAPAALFFQYCERDAVQGLQTQNWILSKYG
ncbi:MAG: hypothetical protein WBE48_13525 [Xanthobacteraceae bacterium]